jgi:hypothetical protein
MTVIKETVINERIKNYVTYRQSVPIMERNTIAILGIRSSPQVTIPLYMLQELLNC